MKNTSNICMIQLFRLKAYITSRTLAAFICCKNWTKYLFRGCFLRESESWVCLGSILQQEKSGKSTDVVSSHRRTQYDTPPWFRNFANFSSLPKRTLAIEYHVEAQGRRGREAEKLDSTKGSGYHFPETLKNSKNPNKYTKLRVQLLPTIFINAQPPDRNQLQPSPIKHDLMTWNRFPYNWPFVTESHWSPVDSRH